MMGTTTDKLNKLLETKAAIKQAIIDKGVEVPDGTTFDEYPNKIAAIEGGGNGPDYTAVYLTKTNNGTTYKNLFDGCTLTELNLSGYDTSNVTTMQSMFNNCTKLTSLDLSSFDTSKVTNMYWMFMNCNSLISLDLSNFDTSAVTTMESMFNRCTALTSLDASNWDTSNVTTMQYMFLYCSKLKSLDLSSFNTSNHNTGIFNSMFNSCSSLETLDIRNFNLSYYDSEDGYMAQNMFDGCTSLHTIYMNNCNAYTIAEITSTLDLVSYKGSQPQIIYCKEDNLIHPGTGTRIQPPSGWRFEYVD